MSFKKQGIAPVLSDPIDMDRLKKSSKDEKKADVSDNQLNKQKA